MKNSLQGATMKLIPKGWVGIEKVVIRAKHPYMITGKETWKVQGCKGSAGESGAQRNRQQGLRSDLQK